MKGYNIYYNGVKINNNVLTSSQLQKVYDEKYIYKRNNVTGNIDKINTQQLETRECIRI